jgi:hypothetical protein
MEIHKDDQQAWDEIDPETDDQQRLLLRALQILVMIEDCYPKRLHRLRDNETFSVIAQSKLAAMLAGTEKRAALAGIEFAKTLY